jgi:hypothetical protein
MNLPRIVKCSKSGVVGVWDGKDTVKHPSLWNDVGEVCDWGIIDIRKDGEAIHPITREEMLDLWGRKHNILIVIHTIQSVLARTLVEAL